MHLRRRKENAIRFQKRRKLVSITNKLIWNPITFYLYFLLKCIISQFIICCCCITTFLDLLFRKSIQKANTDSIFLCFVFAEKSKILFPRAHHWAHGCIGKFRVFELKRCFLKTVFTNTYKVIKRNTKLFSYTML